MSEHDEGVPHPPANDVPRTVEYEKFARTVSAKRGLEQQVAELREQLQATEERASSVDTLAKQLEAANAGRAEAEQRFERYQSISSAVGTTDSDVIDVFAWQYGRLPAEDRPELGTWITTLREAPDSAPASLRGFLTTDTATVLAPSSEPKQPKQRRPSPSAGHVTPPGGSSAYSAAEIRAVRREALATGDWSKLARMQKEMTGTAD